MRTDAQTSDKALAQDIAVETSLHVSDAENAIFELSKLVGQAATPAAIVSILQTFKAARSDVDQVLLTHRMLLQRIWGAAYGGEAEYLRVYINRLRQKLEPDPANPRYILTEPGVGYRFVAPDSERAHRWPE